MKNILGALTLYTSAKCNLKCKYCYIPKNPELLEFDNYLKKSFENNYYLELLSKLEKYYDMSKVQEIAMWGSEPSYGFSRCCNVLSKILDRYKTIDIISSSSNLTTDCYFDGINDIISILLSKNRTFIIKQQISIDGPPWINDFNRGDGTTEKVIKNFDRLLEFIESSPDNIKYKLSLKPTLHIDQIRKLNTKENIINYYKFFEDNFLEKFYSYRLDDKHSFNFANATYISPYNYTKQDGIDYANFIRLSYEICKEGTLKYSHPIKRTIRSSTNCSTYNPYGLSCNNPFCGSCFHNIGLLPDDYVCICHRSFSSMYEKYIEVAKKYSSDYVNNKQFRGLSNMEPMCFKVDKLPIYFDTFKSYQNSFSSTVISNFSNIVRELASLNQIDNKYASEKEAIRIANSYMNYTNLCPKNCSDVTGSISLPSFGSLRLMLNGAIDVYLKETPYEL